jgi:hypothetical protein
VTWRSVLAGALLPTLAAASAFAATPRTPSEEIGKSIYLRGVLGSGDLLQASREGGGPSAKGADAACVNCHQHSGLGSTHQSRGLVGGRADNVIPPIAGRYLLDMDSSGRARRGKPDLPYVDGMRLNRAPYTEATLARAISEGVDSEGRTLSYLMPRFVLDAADMAALIDYLKTLAPARIPGVTDTVLHFATITTPDTDPRKRRAVLEVIEKFFAERNARQMNPSRQLQASGKTQYSRTMFMVHRQWQLHVWDLTGRPDTWRAQLEQHFAREPVLAVISGVGGHNWTPVHEFCERTTLPCLFPNVEVPLDSQRDFYDLYFSKGVLLEAELIESAIVEAARSAPVQIVHQVYRAGDSGEAGAGALAAALKLHGISVRASVVADGKGLSRALRGAGAGEILVLWLRSPDIAALGDKPAAPTRVFMSGLMGGLEHAPLPAAWRERTQMAYPFDVPQKRVVRVDYPLGWFRIRQIPVVDEQVQADTYLACGLLSEALKNMGGTFVPAYLIEELQSMVEHRLVTGYYPRLSLAENQHFASKGGYVVQFADQDGSRIVPLGDWRTP